MDYICSRPEHIDCRKQLIALGVRESVKNVGLLAEEQSKMNFSAQLQAPMGSEIVTEVIDRAMILDRVGGDEELLREITAIFLEEYPVLIQQIQAALDVSDARRLERAAHSLKGSVANFGAQGATEAAYRLETLGRRGDFRDSGAALDRLLFEFRQLEPALLTLLS